MDISYLANKRDGDVTTKTTPDAKDPSSTANPFVGEKPQQARPCRVSLLYLPSLRLLTHLQHSTTVKPPTMMKIAALAAALAGSASAFAPAATRPTISLLALNAEKSASLPFLNRPPLVSVFRSFFPFPSVVLAMRLFASRDAGAFSVECASGVVSLVLGG
jgi:hypothetical protein